MARTSRDHTYRELRRRRAVVVDQPLLLIAQVQRSGGTLLSQLFDGHPEVHPHPYELKWQEPKWSWPALDLTAGPDELFAALDEDWVEPFAERGYYTKAAKGSRSAYEQLPTAAHPFLFDRDLQRAVFEDRLAVSGRTNRAVLEAYLTSFFNAWIDYGSLTAAPKRWVTAFVPRLQQHPDALAGFRADYPDGALISCVREPAGWLSSAVRHGFDGDEGLRDTLRLWNRSTEAALELADRSPDQTVVVLFDDLVHRPEAVMKDVCTRVGLTYAEVLTRPTFNGRLIPSNSSFEPVPYVDPRKGERGSRDLTGVQRAAVAELSTPLYAEAVARYRLG